MINVSYGRFTFLSGVAALLIPWLCVFAYRVCQRKGLLIKCLFLTFYLALILFLTVYRNPAEESRQINLELFWSYKRFVQADIRWQIYMNVFLFIPLGFLLPFSIRSQFIVTTLIGCALSINIEIVQYYLSIGLCEFDDVFNNTIGTMIGYGYFRLISFFEFKRKDMIDRQIDDVKTRLRKYGNAIRVFAEKIRGKK